MICALRFGDTVMVPRLANATHWLPQCRLALYGPTKVKYMSSLIIVRTLEIFRQAGSIQHLSSHCSSYILTNISFSHDTAH